LRTGGLPFGWFSILRLHGMNLAFQRSGGLVA
jgi:hypothetical protein